MHFSSSFPAPLGLRYTSHKHFTATFSRSNVYSSGDKTNANAAFGHFIRCIILPLCPKSVERGGKKTQQGGKAKSPYKHTFWFYSYQLWQFPWSLLGGKGDIPLLRRKHLGLSCLPAEPYSLQKKQVEVQDCEVLKKMQVM